MRIASLCASLVACAALGACNTKLPAGLASVADSLAPEAGVATEAALTPAAQKQLGLYCQAYVAAKPALAPAPGSAEAITIAYADGFCAPDGTVKTGVTADSSSPAWLQDVLAGLKIAVPLALELASAT